MMNIIVGIIIIAILSLAITFIVRERQKGVKCIGCPYSNNCQSQKDCSAIEEVKSVEVKN
jgi:hypothetical protein